MKSKEAYWKCECGSQVAILKADGNDMIQQLNISYQTKWLNWQHPGHTAVLCEREIETHEKTTAQT